MIACFTKAGAWLGAMAHRSGVYQGRRCRSGARWSHPLMLTFLDEVPAKL